jgi:hypothetical protein
VERANGFANRFLFMLVERSKFLPEGDPVPRETLAPLIERLRTVVTVARTIGLIRRDPEARALWAHIYRKLSDGEPGMVGAILARSEAHVLRLSILYAVLDGSSLVRAPHLEAALAVWAYAEDSARRIFGSRLGLPVADRIYDVGMQRGEMTDTDINDLFKGNRKAAEIDAAMAVLTAQRLASRRAEKTAGRDRTVWTFHRREVYR